MTLSPRSFASVRLNADVIVYRVTEPLFAPEVTLSRLYAHMPKHGYRPTEFVRTARIGCAKPGATLNVFEFVARGHRP